MAYELWDTETRIIIQTFESETEALDAARQLIVVNTPTYPAALALVFERSDGDTTVIAADRQLGAMLQSRG